MCGFSTIICALCLIHFFKSEEDTKNFGEAFNLEKYNKNTDPILSNHSDVESQASNSEAVTNDNGLFENLTKKNTNGNGSPKKQHATRNQFHNLNVEKNLEETNFSFMNYITSNYKQFETKYINKINNKGDSSNFTNYNYNKLQSNEMSDDLSHQMNSEDAPARVSRTMRPAEQVNGKNKKNNRYFSPFDDDDVTVFEQGKNLLQTKNNNQATSDQDESVPLNV